MASKVVCVLIPRTCDSASLHGKEESRLQIKFKLLGLRKHHYRR